MAAASLTILAIDDNRDHLTALKALLAEAFAGVRVLTATNGEEGIALALSENPDVILLDIVLPVADGFAVCRRLKDDERTRQIPVVFLTAARPDSGSRVKALESGAEAFLAGPIEAAELTAQIRAMARIKTANLAELRRAQETLRESEDRCRNLFDQTADIILLLEIGDGLPVILDANQAALAAHGYSRQEMLGQPILLLEPGLTPELVAERRRLTAQGKPMYMTHRRKDGTEFEVESVARWIRIGGRDVVLAVERDITERKRAEREREELRMELAHAHRMESIGRLAGGVAHDFNNLLTVINGYSALIAGRVRPDDPSRPALEQIHRAGERAAGLVRQLLAFSRKQVLEPELLNLNDVVGEIEMMVRRLVGEDVEVLVRLTQGIGAVMADRHQLEQVIMNLAANARDAMPGGGRLTLETGERGLSGACRLCQQAINPGTYVELIVRDTGVGMDERIRQHLFEPFYTTKGAGQGTGLGLSAVQGIVLQSGGHVGIESEPGQGTAFHIYLPLVERRVEEERAQTPRPATGGTETILAVEDQVEVREFTAAVLESFGYHVLRAEDAERALAVCAAQPVDLLLTDVVMPRTSGVELARQARNLRPALKTLFMSGYSEEVHDRRGEDLAGAPFLQKPFSPEALAAKVREVLGEPLHSGRILVVDDEEGVRDYLRYVLEGAGYEVLTASDGREAMKSLSAGGVGLVITDLVMPGQEGIETIQAIRKAHPQLGIIAVSGAGGGAYLRFAKRLGADATLLKPVSPERLLAEVEQRLRDPRVTTWEP